MFKKSFVAQGVNRMDMQKHIYDTLIIGCGYFSVGYALSKGNCIICEENQICDTRFYLPLKSFQYNPYSPKTAKGARLLDIFRQLSLFEGEMQNTNGFECGFCKYIAETGANILLKCRVVEIAVENGIYNVKIQTNEGLSHLYAKNIINTISECIDKEFTALFTTEDIGSVSAELKDAFPGAIVEPAFYRKRYALHIPAGEYDENTVKLAVYNAWNEKNIKAKIIYMAPAFSTSSKNPFSDDFYDNPIKAFEAGCFHAKEEK